MTEGLLQEFKLAEVVQLIGMSEKTGDLELTPLYPARQRHARPPIGHLFFQEGHPHAAFLADRVGDRAAENLFLWEAGFFVVRSLTPAELPPPNLRLSVEALIFRGLGRLEEWNATLALVPTLRAVVCPTSDAGAALDPASREAALLRECDGRRQLSAISVALGWGGLRCREAAATLLRDGHAGYRPFSVGEKLVQALVAAALPTLGVAADLFCDDALAAVGLAPERIGQLTSVPLATVGALLTELERGVAETLDSDRAEALGDHIRATLRLPRRGALEGTIEHV